MLKLLNLIRPKGQALVSKISKFYKANKNKIIIFSGVILLLIAVGISVFLIFNSGKTYTDSDGTIWQKFDNNSNEPLFKIYVEQSSFKDGAYINSECDPRVDLEKTTKLEPTKEQTYVQGIDRPNHCRIISGHYPPSDATEGTSNTFILLPDGSLLTLDGNTISIVQVNIDETGTRIVQSSGNVYYRIAKQSPGKKFVIQVGNQEFTALGTKVFTSIDNETVKLGLFEGAGTLTEFTRDSEAVQVQVGTFAQYLYRSAEQIQLDQLFKMSTKDLLNDNGFFAQQLKNDDLYKLDRVGKVDFSQMQAILPEVVNIAGNNIMNKLQADIEKSNREAQEFWDNFEKEQEAEDEHRAAERQAAHEARIAEQQAATSQSSTTTSTSSSSSSGGTSSGLGCVSKSKPATFSLCKMGGGTVSGSTCCFK